MFFHKEQKLKTLSVIFLTSLAFSACKSGLIGGNTQEEFAGITAATVLGPSTISLDWDTSQNCNSYNIYQMTSNSSSAIANLTLPPAVLRSTDGIQSETSYTFSVACVGTEGESGLNATQTVTTWANFDNSTVAYTAPTLSSPNLFTLSWAFSESGVLYEVYYKELSLPTDLAAWSLTRTGGSGTAYTGTLACMTSSSSITVGSGGDCSLTLTPGSLYGFKVIARYPDGNYSDDTGGVSALAPSDFTAPTCRLTSSGLGAESNTSYLFLICDSAADTSTCALSDISYRAYQNISGTRTSVSDTLTGTGSLRIEPTINASQSNTREVDDLEIEYTCTSGTPVKAIVRYNGTDNAKPTLKYGDAGHIKAPVRAVEKSPAFLGKATTIGDFDCNGQPDLAVGLPDVTYTTEPFASRNAETGLVKVYYNYATSSSGVTVSNPNDIQYLTFRDLPAYAHFGQSLSSGNLNRDFAADASDNYSSCDDLIIGAPGTSSSSNYTGAAYIYYGNPQRLSTPLDSASVAKNAPTCTGTIDASNCGVVKLSPDLKTFYDVDPYHSAPSITGSSTSASRLGFSVSFVGDHNADGYGDVAIGDPYCDWDGEVANGVGYSAANVNKLVDVGCVYVYWGGPGGVQNVYVGDHLDAATHSNAAIYSPFVKTYPPIPVAGMHFGWSISKGGDVDGALPVPVTQNGSRSLILASGSDFIVGAPDFSYASPGSAAGNTQVVTNWSLGASDSIDPSLNQSVPAEGGTNSPTYIVTNNTNTPSAKTVAPLNGAWAISPTAGAGSNPATAWDGVQAMPTPSNAALLNSTGIAVLYKGRHAYTNYKLSTIASAYDKFPYIYQNEAQVMSKLTTNIQHRQNGSSSFEWPAAVTMTYLHSPTHSFYNCSTRGSPVAVGTDPSSATTSGYKHFSCMAGRNNFSLIYPHFASGATSADAVTQFGLSVGMSAPPEQNAVALFQSLRQASGYQSLAGGSGNTLVTLSSGADLSSGSPTSGTHPQIRGTSLWEVGLRGITTISSGAMGTPVADDYCSGVASCTPAGAADVWIGRSMIKETYASFTELITASNAVQKTDGNQDGYADVLVGTGLNSSNSKSWVYSFFGNYAADFSYAATVANTNSCSVTRSAVTPADNFDTAWNGTVAPYSTFQTYVATGYNVAGTTDTYGITGEYPSSPLPVIGSAIPARWLDDTAAVAGGSFNYNYTTVTRYATDGGNSTKPTYQADSRCKPQRKQFSSAVTSIATADINNDGTVDAVISLPTANSSLGRTIVTYAYSSGFNTDINFTNGSPNSLMGTSAVASNWKFMDNTVRRDLWLGAPGYAGFSNDKPGDGIIYNYSRSESLNLNTSYTSYIIDDPSNPANSPNGLNVNKSKIIGDVNGDGYDDIFVPVKQIGTGGSVYYDAVIYYGSTFGPMTTEFCRSKASVMTKASGSFSSSDCEPSVSTSTASLASTTVRLPQYFTRPLNIDANWALYVQEAGDISGDGKSDIAVLIPGIGAYAFFGSDSGLVNGQPVRSPSTSGSPQIITTLTGFTAAGLGISIDSLVSYPAISHATVDTTYPFTHGDFNKDGYADIAIGLPGLNSPSLNSTTWACDTFMDQPGYVNYCGQTAPAIAASKIPIQSHGGVLVVYGGTTGLQIPTSGGIGIEYDFGAEACDDFHTNCASSGSTLQSVYGSLTVTSTGGGTGAVDLVPANAACAPNASGSGVADCAKSTLIKNPLFHNHDDSFITLTNKQFGLTLTTSDLNGDGVDDLVVGAPNYSNGNSGADVGAITVDGVSGADVAGKGAVFIYHGLPNYGLVAPTAQTYIGDSGLGLSSSGQPAIAFEGATYALYPKFPGAPPTLDPSETSRQFGRSIASGDFNGDNKDDLAVTNIYGQVYVYYGPICQHDNSSTAATASFASINTPVAIGTPTLCKAFDLSAVTSASTTANLTDVTGLREFNFHTIYTSNLISTNSGFGTTLVSKRPVRNSSGTVLYNPGNIDGDDENTSDLVIATDVLTDPNTNITNGKTSGLGFILFGHAPASISSMTTTAGLYVGTANYNRSIVGSTCGASTCYHFAPMMLKPYEADGSVAEFFKYPTTLGDLNGDSRGDMIMNTGDLHRANDGSSVIYGGGFKLMY